MNKAWAESEDRNFDIDFRNLALILKACIEDLPSSISNFPPAAPIVQISKTDSAGDNDYLQDYAATRCILRGAEVEQDTVSCRESDIPLPFITKLIFVINDVLANNEMIDYSPFYTYDPDDPDA